MNLASEYARAMVETLLHVHALASMHRANPDVGHLTTAMGWVPILERQFADLKEHLAPPLSTTGRGADNG